MASDGFKSALDDVSTEAPHELLGVDKEIIHCSITSWLPLFEDDTIKSVLVDIPPALIDYLDEGGSVLWDCPGRPSPTGDCSGSDTGEGRNTDQWLDSEGDGKQRPRFDEFDQQVSAALLVLGGSAFIKVNCHAPLDARWLSSDHSLRVTNLDDVHIILAASNRLQIDIQAAQRLSECGNCSSPGLRPVLVLRQWTNITPCSEFRCFVVNNRLVAVCQRDISQCFPFLSTSKDRILEVIGKFYRNRLRGRFSISNYCFDVFCDNMDSGSMCVDRSRCQVTLLDFGIIGQSSGDPLLFSSSQLTGELCLFCEAPIDLKIKPTESDAVEEVLLCDQCLVDSKLPVFQSIAASSRTIVAPPYLTRWRPIDMDPSVGPDTHGAALLEILRAAHLGDSDSSLEASESADN